LEFGNGARYREVVQHAKGVRIYSAGRWWPGRLRPYFGISAVERAGLNSLNEGQDVEYDIVTDRGKQSAGNLKVNWSSGGP
jgi:hypothetical protein